jgi:peptidoglycan/LPS O-acetylase OafA/YrhL
MATTSPILTAAPAMPSTTTGRTRRFWRTGAIAGVAASAANMAVVLAARAADVEVSVDHERIPVVGFAQLTLVGAVLGVLLASVIAKRARRPRHLFVTVTAVLTALSIVPDVLVDTDTSSKLVLAATHLLAAVIIVPALAARVPE